MIKEKRAKYLFAVFNTDRKNKPGTHWWSFLDIYPKKDLLLFDSFGFTGFKQFIVDNDKNIIDKIKMLNLEKLIKRHKNQSSLINFRILQKNKIKILT